MYKILRFITLALLIVICASHSFGNKPTKIVILVGDDLTSTKRTVRGAKKVIQIEHPNAEFATHIINISETNKSALIDTINIEAPSLILTIGSSPTQFAKDNFKNTPIIFSSVKYPVLSGFVNSIKYPGKNITGASINIPTDVQFEKFKEIIPNLKKIGVLYTENTEPLIPQAKIIAEELGLELVALKVTNERDLPKMLDSLASNVQGIWSVADHNLFKPKSTRYILINTLRKRIPFMGFSKYVVESGALFALDFDYKAVGLQAGSIVNKVLSGENPANISVTTADVIWFHYNEKTAERIKITIPPELAAVAKEVYR
ncbi:MAG: hypothetical protein DWP97_05020 [Calditrichaeota bacterium]|nr:MAG: hypothetical protein DWP97_05020 [Calditrichota bacterium]